MSDAEIKLEPGKTSDLGVDDSVRPSVRNRRRLHAPIIPLLITLASTVLAAALGWAMWKSYIEAPWTRDGRVRTYVTTMASEVAGRIVEMPVVDNQFVHKGDLLVVIDPIDYSNALRLAEASVVQSKAVAENARTQAERRRKLTDLAETVEDRQTYEANAAATQAEVQQALVNRDQAKINLHRTEIRSPVNGWVINLLARIGDYATIGKNIVSVVDADSFWVDAYFEETNLPSIHEGDTANIKLMGHRKIVSGQVAGIARGITVANAQPDPQGLANVNPIFTWVRLAQRVPVHIRITDVPDGVRLVAGLTATVQLDPPARRPAN